MCVSMNVSVSQCACFFPEVNDENRYDIVNREVYTDQAMDTYTHISFLSPLLFRITYDTHPQMNVYEIHQYSVILLPFCPP